MYLDSSAIIKRYVFELGSSTVDYVIDKGWIGEASIATSIWNIGEVLGVLDERYRRGWLSEDEFKSALERFAGETIRLSRLKVLQVLPILTPMLVEAWPLILSEHIYEADAIQIRTSVYSGSKVLLSGDEGLINVALRNGLKAINIENEEEVEELFK